MTGEEATLRPLGVADAAMTLAWRNRDAVRLAMFDPTPLEAEGHTRWISAVEADPDRAYFVYQEDGRPLGVVGLIFTDRAAGVGEWSFHIGAQDAPKGAGGRMLTAALAQFFGPLGGARLEAEVLDDNEASLRLHRRLGFRYIGARSEPARHLGALKPVHRFEMNREDWRKGLGG
ncbi:MAG: GNAT family N-acetyltransferase [Pseudomonadota bacterium]